MCNMMDGLVPVSSLLLIHLLLSSRAASGACVTGVVTISWRRRRWHRRVAAIACLWRSRRRFRAVAPLLARFAAAVASACSFSRSRHPSVLWMILRHSSLFPLAASSVHLHCSWRAALPVRVVPCLGVWIIEFIIQLNEELFKRMAEGHAGPSNDAGRRAPRCEQHPREAVHVHPRDMPRPPKKPTLKVVLKRLQSKFRQQL